MHLPESTNMLIDAGIDFEKLNKHGIEPLHFWELLICSGTIINDEVTWVTFHGASDFAYFVRGLHNQPLPATLAEFTDLTLGYFPNIFDIKTILNEIQIFRNGSLQKLAFDLDVPVSLTSGEADRYPAPGRQRLAPHCTCLSYT